MEEPQREKHRRGTKKAVFCFHAGVRNELRPDKKIDVSASLPVLQAVNGNVQGTKPQCGVRKIAGRN